MQPDFAAGSRPGRARYRTQFQDDIRTSLGPRFKAIQKAEQLAMGDGRFLYRVAVTGEANKKSDHVDLLSMCGRERIADVVGVRRRHNAAQAAGRPRSRDDEKSQVPGAPSPCRPTNARHDLRFRKVVTIGIALT